MLNRKRLIVALIIWSLLLIFFFSVLRQFRVLRIWINAEKFFRRCAVCGIFAAQNAWKAIQISIFGTYRRHKGREFNKNRPRVRIYSSDSRGLYFTQQNPVNGQNSFHSQGLIYDDLKMTIYKLPSLRLTATGYPVGAATCRPQKMRSIFPLLHRALRGYNRGEAAQTV